MTLRVEQGKGAQGPLRHALAVLLERLRTWWRVAHAQGKMLPGGWLFPGMNRDGSADAAATQPRHP
jgi:integrase/recombinase XerD